MGEQRCFCCDQKSKVSFVKLFLTIFSGQMGLFVHPVGYLYSFFGKHSNSVKHGILSELISAKIQAGLVPNWKLNAKDLFPPEKKPFGSPNFCRISIVGRTLNSVQVSDTQFILSFCDVFSWFLKLTATNARFSTFP
jgi:hypothetical protein